MRSAEALAAALLVAAGFASLGRRIAGPGEPGLAGWNSRFQIGAAAAAMALFPLSLIAGKAALAVLGGALAALLAVELFRASRSGRVADFRAGFGLAEAALVAAVLLFAILNARVGLVTDGISIWAGKGRALFEDGALSERLSDPSFLGRYSLYPPLVPLSSALVGIVCRRFDADVAKAFAPVFFASLLVAVRSGGLRLFPRRIAAGAALVAAFLPAVSTDWNAGGFAELPLAAFAAGAAAALLDPSPDAGWRSARGWHLAALTTIKPEGTILALVAGFAAVAGGPKAAMRRAFRWRRAGAIIGGALLVRIAYLEWIALPDEAFRALDRGHVEAVFHAIPRVAIGCAGAAFDVRLWGLFWPAVLAAAAVLARRGTARERRLAAGVTLAVGIDAAIFLFSTWNERAGISPEAGIARHIALAFPRLLEQVAGAAAIVLGAGWSRAAEPGLSGDARRV